MPAFTRILVVAVVLGSTGIAAAQMKPIHPMGTNEPGDKLTARKPAPPWRDAEAGALRNHVQLTFPKRFHKAGEAYFSPDDQRIVFQAVEAPPEGEAADEFYAMFVADVVHGPNGRIMALDAIRRVSPEGSANTCGWFHPTRRGVVLFGSTIGPPSDSTPPGYQRATGRYRWMFPPEMKIVTRRLDGDDSAPGALDVIVDAGAYAAEGSIDREGRRLLYCSLESGGGDLFVLDLETGRRVRVVQTEGYDGGPFFSPDGRRICYRSDRRGDHLLQLFVGDLAFNEDGAVVGLEREYQLTDNTNVNWCPFWHPDGRHLVFATSEVGHHNYEVFMVDADPGSRPGSSGTIRYGTHRRRITNADGADVLPSFSSDGQSMMWTSQRGSSGRSQLWVADFVLDVDAAPTSMSREESSAPRGAPRPRAVGATGDSDRSPRSE